LLSATAGELAASRAGEQVPPRGTLQTLSAPVELLRPAPSNARAYLAWAAVCLIWGTTYLGIRISLETIPPLLMAAMRWIVAGSLLIALLAIRGERLP